MKQILLFALCAYFLVTTIEATSEPVCGYTALDGHMVFLRYISGLKEGQQFVDYGQKGSDVCQLRVTCLETYLTQIDKCSDSKVSCENKQTFDGEFPACCVKC